MNEVNSQSHPTVDSLLNQFINSLRERNASERTIKAYNHDARKFIEFCGQDIAAVLPKDIERFIERMAQSGVKFSTLKRTLSAVKEFFNFLSDRGVINRNPASKVRIATIPRNLISAENVVSLFQYVAEHQRSDNIAISLRYRRDELILLFMVFFGVRQYQIPLLKLSAIERNGELLTLRVNDRLVLKLSGAMLAKLRDYLSLRSSSSDAMFLDPLDGTSISANAVHSLLQDLNYRLNLRSSSSTLYHTFLHLQNNPEERNQLLSRVCAFANGQGCGQPPAFQGTVVHA